MTTTTAEIVELNIRRG